MATETVQERAWKASQPKRSAVAAAAGLLRDDLSGRCEEILCGTSGFEHGTANIEIDVKGAGDLAETQQLISELLLQELFAFGMRVKILITQAGQSLISIDQNPPPKEEPEAA